MDANQLDIIKKIWGQIGYGGMYQDEYGNPTGGGGQAQAPTMPSWPSAPSGPQYPPLPTVKPSKFKSKEPMPTGQMPALMDYGAMLSGLQSPSQQMQGMFGTQPWFPLMGNFGGFRDPSVLGPIPGQPPPAADPRRITVPGGWTPNLPAIPPQMPTNPRWLTQRNNMTIGDMRPEAQVPQLAPQTGLKKKQKAITGGLR